MGGRDARKDYYQDRIVFEPVNGALARVFYVVYDGANTQVILSEPICFPGMNTIARLRQRLDGVDLIAAAYGTIADVGGGSNPQRRDRRHVFPTFWQSLRHPVFQRRDICGFTLNTGANLSWCRIALRQNDRSFFLKYFNGSSWTPVTASFVSNKWPQVTGYLMSFTFAPPTVNPTQWGVFPQNDDLPLQVVEMANGSLA